MTKTTDLDRTRELYDFLRGVAPDCYTIPEANMPDLTPNQAWTVIWYLGNEYWQVPDHIERCDLCGHLYDSDVEGEFVEYGPGYHICEDCEHTPEATRHRRIARKMEERRMREYRRNRNKGAAQAAGEASR